MKTLSQTEKVFKNLPKKPQKATYIVTSEPTKEQKIFVEVTQEPVGKVTYAKIGKVTSAINPDAGLTNTITGEYLIKPKKVVKKEKKIFAKYFKTKRR